jgi:alkylated DNA nucleotide flippase Atl1
VAEKWTPPRQVYFKKQTLNMWRVTDSDGMRHVNADQAFAQMQELVEDGWRCQMQESVVGHIMSVTMTEPEVS